MNFLKKCSGASFDSLVLIAVKLLTILSSMAIVKILSVKFSLAEYGIYSAIMIVVNLITNVTILGLLDAVNFYFNQSTDRENRERIICSVVTIEVVLSSVCAILAILFRNSIAVYFGNQQISLLLFCAAWIPLSMNLIAIYQILYLAIGKGRFIGVASLIATVSKMLCVVFVVYTSKSILNIFECILLVTIVQALGMAFLFNKISGYKFGFKMASIDISIDVIKYAIPIGAYILVNTLTKESDKLVIGYFSNASALAMYTNASKPLPFDIFTASFMTILIPYITRYLALKNVSEAAKALSEYYKISFIGVWGLALGVFLYPEGLIALLYSEQYTSMKIIFLLYILVDMVRVFQISILFSATNNGRLLLKYIAVVCASNIFLDVILYKQFGDIGPAVATLLVSLIHSWYMLYKGASLIDLSIKEILDIKFIMKQITKIFLCLIVVYCMFSFVDLSDFNTIVKFILVYASYMLSLLIVFYKTVIEIVKEINKVKFV